MTRTNIIISTAICLATLISGATLAQTATSPTPPITPTVAQSSEQAPLTGTNTLTVTVAGVRSSRGVLRAALLKADYNIGTTTNAGATIINAAEGTTTIIFTNLADGDYAVRMFHDEDANGEMKTNLFGIPSEGYAFSNGARAAFGPPKFADMKVSVTADTTTIANMAY